MWRLVGSVPAIVNDIHEDVYFTVFTSIILWEHAFGSESPLINNIVAVCNVSLIIVIKQISSS